MVNAWGWFVRPLAAVAWGLALAGCGSDDGPPPPPPTPIGAAGGTVAGAAGASVFVPVGAVAAGGTVEIGLVAGTGLPHPLPDGYTPVGTVYEVTPHGHYFGKPVELRIPVPSVALAAGERLLLAKAPPGGGWEILTDTALAEGMLTARVLSFSTVTAVTARDPLAFTTSALDCGATPCSQQIGSHATLTYDWATNGSPVPGGCQPGTAYLKVEASTTSALPPVFTELQRLAPFPDSGRVTATLPAPQRGSLWVSASVRCVQTGAAVEAAVAIAPLRNLAWSQFPAGAAVVGAPASVDVVPGVQNTLTHLFNGGAGGPAGSSAAVPIRPPTAADTAVIQWHISRDDGATWSAQPLATTRQVDGDPLPLAGEREPWWVWSSTLRFEPAAADHGALIRATVCYANLPCSDGPVTRLNVLQQAVAPVITVPPASLMITAGSTASFTATAAGAPAPTVRWQTRAPGASDWVDVPGATGSELTTAALPIAENGRSYRLAATNALGTSFSAPAMVVITEQPVAPVITVQPAPFAAPEGGTAVFAVAATGTAPLTYQWYRDGNLLPVGGATALLRLSPVLRSQAAEYRVVVTNAAGSVTSSTVALTLVDAAAGPRGPVIIAQPVPATVDAGSTAVFGVGVTGASPLAFQWLRDRVEIPGATSAFYAIPSAQLADQGSYAVRISNGIGTPVTSSAAALTVSVTEQRLTPVTLLAQPAPQLQPAGGSATFTVGVTGSPTLRFQWFKDATAIAGATGPQLTLTNLASADVGRYSVEVANDINTVTSVGAALVVLGVPTITTQPAAATVAAGQSATFSVVATGEDLRYQWTRNSVAIAGANGASYTTPTLAAGDGGAVYGVVVFNANGIAISDPAVLTVTP